jgi:3-methylcrotonyl-CoA carboxylase alpha subunit
VSAPRAKHTIRKLLIANRGEVAVRIITACHEAGIQPVAVYSEADCCGLHVQLAAEAVCIGPAHAAQSYLNQQAIVAAAKAYGCDGVHPGYGFLAENADFADRCRAEGLVFVGPPSEAMRLMADKAAAKRLARDAGVPVVPGYDGEDQSDANLASEARRIGFPLMVKAALGGGGKGMHAVRNSSELRRGIAQARRESIAAFGDGRLILERLLERPRHIEVQVIGDVFGALVAVGERECSIQRRHQKVIEESPSPAVDAILRRRLSDFALAIATRAAYSNAGTVEFLVSQAGEVYFLEMNTRLQVEHAVTEAVYGIDLVRLQLDLAAGNRLALRQGDLRARGHAIECRIYAEDPSSGFLPSTGRVLAFRVPEGPGIRNDVGTFAGDEIGPDYDPLLAKLTVHAPDRTAAVARMRAALDRYTLLGLHSNIPLLRSVVREPAFERGELDVEFLDREQRLSTRDLIPPPEVLFAATAAELLRPGIPMGQGTLFGSTGPWRLGGQDRRFSWECGGEPVEVRASRGTAGWTFRSGQSEFSGQIELSEDGVVLLRAAIGGSVARLDIATAGCNVWAGRRGETWLLTRPNPRGPEARAGAQQGGMARSLTAPMPGRVARVEVQEGQAVRPHQVLVILEAMKMEHAIEAQEAGVVLRLHCRPGDLVSAGSKLVDLDAPG